MRRLLLFRHAKAEVAEFGGSDRARTLSDRGRKEAGKIGAYMASHALVPDRVLVSPAARTQETWKHTSTAFRPVPGAATVDRLYDASPHDILAAIKDAPANTLALMVVAHNPGLHDLALMLVATGDVDTRERLREKLPTAGLVIIDFAFDDWEQLHPQSGRLERFVSPKSLEAAAS